MLSVTFLQKVSSPVYLGWRCRGQENASGEGKHLAPLQRDSSNSSQGSLLVQGTQHHGFCRAPWCMNPVLSLQQGTALCVHLAWRSSDEERKILNISSY